MGCGVSKVKALAEKVIDAPPSKEELPNFLAQLKSATRPDPQKACARGLMFLCKDEACTAQVVKQGGVATILTWTAAKDSSLQFQALRTATVIAGHEDGAAAVVTPEFVRQLMTYNKGKDRALLLPSVSLLAVAATIEAARQVMVDEGLWEWTLALSKTKNNAMRHQALLLMSKLAENVDQAHKAVATDIDGLIKYLFDTAFLVDDTNVEKSALTCIARLGVVKEFGDKVAETNNLSKLFRAANDSIASRKVPAALAVANMANNKDLRVKLVKHRAYQLFVEMGKVGSQRADMMEYQRIAALGIRNLASNYQLRELADKVGALPVVVKMLGSPVVEVQRYAAKACSELTLHEENGRKLCFGGALLPLISMARSGDRYCENEAVTALSNLAISEENQRHMVKEGGVRALQYLTHSSNPRVTATANKLITRIRMAKLRTAARFAGRLAIQQRMDNGEDVGGGDMEPNNRLPPIGR
mmetsp:Transcript_1285/g.4291  ORF Transcript_1285/g.4291 Transcript_1285/m.4291 type:complete len:473 (-) Transcript_1285:817-2235(-)